MVNFSGLYLDDGGYQPSTPTGAPDLSLSAAAAAAAAAAGSQNSYEVVIENIDLNLYKEYAFVFSYILSNDDPKDTTIVLGPSSPRFVVTQAQVASAIPDYTQLPANVVVSDGLLSYQVSWDKPTWENYTDTIIWEGSSSVFTGSEKVVWTGTDSQATILTSSTAVRYIKILHRDKFFHSNTTSADKYVIKGPINPVDPIVVDANPPSNNFTVGLVTIQDDPDGLFTFNKKILFSWGANTDTSTYGYQIRFRIAGTTDYTYMSVPGRTTTSTYLYGVKAGQTYEIQVSTYDQFGNTNTSDWKSYPNIVIPPSTSLAPDVAITAGDMKMGYGIGGNNANKGLYLGPENYWYIQGNTTASSAARLSVGGTNDKLVWDGTNLSVTGNLTARTGTFSGNILLASTNASIYNGTINSAGNLTGNGFALNSTGLKVANGANSVTISATDGTITANAGSIGNWSLSGTQIFKNNAVLDSSGYIQLGNSNVGTIVRLTSAETASSDGNTYRMWIGSNDPTTAAFRVTSGGKLFATSAKLNNIDIGSAFSDGTTLGTVKDQAAAALSSNGTFNGTLSGNVQVTGYGSISTVASNAANAVSSGTVDTKISNAFSTSTNYSSAAIIQRINESLGIGESSTSRINGSLLISGTVAVDALVGTYIYGKEIYQGYEPTFASGFNGGGIAIKQDVFPLVGGFQPGIIFYGTDKIQAGLLGSWSSHNMTYATSYLGNYIDLIPDDNSLNIVNADTYIGTQSLTLSASAMSISTISRGRNVATWSSQPGRSYTITHNQGATCTIIATAEHNLNDLVCTIRSKTDTQAVIDVYHRAGANVSGDVRVNWIAISTTNA